MTPNVNKILFTAVAGGDQKAFAELFAKYKDRTYTIAFLLTDDVVVSEELVQDVFLRVWKNRHKLHELEDFPSWLYTITRNRALTALEKIARDGKNKAEFISYLPAEINDTDTKITDQHLNQLLETALSRLSKQQRKVFELCRLKGFNREEVALQLGLSPATVSVHLTIALRSVRAFLSSQIDSSLIIIRLSLLFKD